MKRRERQGGVKTPMERAREARANAWFLRASEEERFEALQVFLETGSSRAYYKVVQAMRKKEVA